MAIIKSGMELLVVGADGMDPRLTNYYLEKGYLPHIESLLNQGAVFGSMASRTEGHEVPQTGPAWTTIYTGLRARDHKVTQGGWTTGEISLIPRYDHTVFSSLTDAGYAVGSFTMPITYPASAKGDSWMVSGFPTASIESDIAAPESVYELLPDDYEAVQAKGLFGDDGPLHVNQWIQCERRKVTEILPTILDEHPVDVLFYGTQVTDTMGHRSTYKPRYLDGAVQMLTNRLNRLLDLSLSPPRMGSLAWNSEMRQAYELLDEILGTIVNKYDPDKILLLSDHGFKLDARDHAFVGNSLAMGNIHRPESILEVRECIEASLGMKNNGDGEVDIDEGDLDDESTEMVREQLDSLGYL